MNIHIAIPSSSFEGSGSEDFKKKFKANLVLAIQSKKVPDFSYSNISVKPDMSFKVSLSDNDYNLLSNELKKHSGTKIGELAAGLVYRDSSLSMSKSNPSLIKQIIPKLKVNSPSLAAYLASSGKSENKEQIELSNLINSAMNSPEQTKVLLAEASTGVGKGAVIVSSAIDTAKNGNLVVVSAPSFKVLSQLVKEHLIVDESAAEIAASNGGYFEPTAFSLIYGKQEFVSSIYIQTYLSSLDLEQEVDAGNAIKDELANWVKNGAPDRPDVVVEKLWSMSGLTYHCPSILDVEAFKLKAAVKENDSGYITYRQQFKQIADSMVIYCSHAMLARDLMKKIIDIHRIKLADPDTALEYKKIQSEWQLLTADKKYTKELIDEGNELFNTFFLEIADTFEIETVLPEYNYLLIDESHLFEQNVNNSLSKSFAMHSMTTLMHNFGYSSDASRFKREFLNEFARIGETSDKAMHWLDESNAKLLSNMYSFLSNFKKKLMKSKAKNELILREVEYATNTIRLIIKTSNHEKYCGYVRFSPIYSYPSIYAGSGSIKRELDFLWRRKHVALVSATLYIPTASKEADSQYLSDILALPKGKVEYMAPIRPKWITEPVTLLKSDSLIKSLIPAAPGEFKDAEALKSAKVEWTKSVGQYVQKVYETAEGGTMVLCTSYESAGSLYDELKPILGDDLILSSSTEKIEVTTKAFIALSKREKKPVWLAVGQSWTGVDLSGRNLLELGQEYDPHKDNLLTDLVIPRLPFGLNQSVSHARRAKYYFLNEANETIILLMQGFGRLVRAKGLPNNRRIHFLDQRVHLDKFQFIKTQIAFLFNRYKNKSAVKQDENGAFLI